MTRTRSRVRRSALRVLALACAVLFAALPACTREKTKPNILVILADTLRADRLGAYGSERGLTPFLDSLAERAFVFRNAHSQTSWTSPSIATLFTSRYPSQHQVTSFRSPLVAGERTLAEVLAQRGYISAAFSANFLLNPRFGYWQGFTHYRVFFNALTDAQGNPTFAKTRAGAVNEAALAWLDKRNSAGEGKPVFLYVHYMEPHTPYSPEPSYLAHVLQGRPAPDRIDINKRVLLANLGAVPDDLRQSIEDFYDAEVMSLDAQLRALFAALERRHFLDRTVVVVTADHGEELREHGAIGHGTTLHEEVLRIPLLILLPGQKERVDVDALVSLVDVAPTLVDLSGGAPPDTFEGHSLRAWMGGATGQGRDAVVFGELLKEGVDHSFFLRQRTFITARGKVIEGEGEEAQYYDLNRDPGERDANALAPAERARLTQELAAMARRVAASPPAAAPTPEATLDNETRERMRALGYGE